MSSADEILEDDDFLQEVTAPGGAGRPQTWQCRRSSKVLVALRLSSCRPPPQSWLMPTGREFAVPNSGVCGSQEEKLRNGPGWRVTRSVGAGRPRADVLVKVFAK